MLGHGGVAGDDCLPDFGASSRLWRATVRRHRRNGMHYPYRCTELPADARPSARARPRAGEPAWDGLTAAASQASPGRPDRGAHRVQRRRADRGRGATKQLPALCAPDRPRPKLVSEEVEPDIRIRPFYVFCLCSTRSWFWWVQFQAAL